MSNDWNSQIRRGLLELCVLAILERQPGYGYEIVSQLSDESQLAVREGTVYPLLRRLKSQGLLATHWQESEAGPPRQYYRLSKAGQARLELLRAQWRELAQSVTKIVDGRADSLEMAR